MSHTPGPWNMETVPTSNGTCHKIGPFPWNGAHKENYACVYADQIRPHDYGHSKVGDELLANARLISAAPELLDACDMSINTLLGCCVAGGGVDDRKTMLETIAMLRAAINKALGK